MSQKSQNKMSQKSQEGHFFVSFSFDFHFLTKTEQKRAVSKRRAALRLFGTTFLHTHKLGMTKFHSNHS
jgi:hypothetical protein